MRYRLTMLEKMHVVRDDGKDLGRFVDLRTRAKIGRMERAGLLDIDALLIGAAGWLERLGLRDGGSREVPPKAIIAVERERIIVRTLVAGKAKSRGNGRRR